MTDRRRVGLAWGLAGLTLALAPTSLVVLPMVWRRLTAGAGTAHIQDRLDAGGERSDISKQLTQGLGSAASEPAAVAAAALPEPE
jgi:hypothetical protein